MALQAAIERGALAARIVAVCSNRPEAPWSPGPATTAYPSPCSREADHPNRVAAQEAMAAHLAAVGARLVVLAGRDQLLVPTFVGAFAGRVLNVSPSLLPAFAGTMHAVEDALAYGVKLTGVYDPLRDRGPTTPGRSSSQAAVPVLDAARRYSPARAPARARAPPAPASHRPPRPGRLRIEGRRVRHPRGAATISARRGAGPCVARRLSSPSRRRWTSRAPRRRSESAGPGSSSAPSARRGARHLAELAGSACPLLIPSRKEWRGATRPRAVDRGRSYDAGGSAAGAVPPARPRGAVPPVGGRRKAMRRALLRSSPSPRPLRSSPAPRPLSVRGGQTWAVPIRATAATPPVAASYTNSTTPASSTPTGAQPVPSTNPARG